MALGPWFCFYVTRNTNKDHAADNAQRLQRRKFLLPPTSWRMDGLVTDLADRETFAPSRMGHSAIVPLDVLCAPSGFPFGREDAFHICSDYVCSHPSRHLAWVDPGWMAKVWPTAMYSAQRYGVQGTEDLNESISMHNSTNTRLWRGIDGESPKYIYLVDPSLFPSPRPLALLPLFRHGNFSNGRNERVECEMIGSELHEREREEIALGLEPRENNTRSNALPMD